MTVETPLGRKPAWLKVALPGSPGYLKMRRLLSSEKLNTICLSGRCPNVDECFSRGTATFMLMGQNCTRACQYCNVALARPEPLDAGEPDRVAQAVARLALRFVVLTSVTRDDLPDGGADHIGRTIERVREVNPRVKIEILVPDFRRKSGALTRVLAARPDVLAHNIETVERLHRKMRPGGDFHQSLDILRHARDAGGPWRVKSGFMLGLGEVEPEAARLLEQLHESGCEIVTIGQYLQPSPAHAPVDRYWHPSEFERLRGTGEALGFHLVVAGPLVRSSYLADKAFEEGNASSGTQEEWNPGKEEGKEGRGEQGEVEKNPRRN